MGLNAIQLYVPWNLHNPDETTYIWTGFADIERFLQMAADLNLVVLLRPGPYICAEWDYGGFPTWLSFNNNNSMRLRTSDPNYLSAVDEWWGGHLFPKIKPFLIQNGGPIGMVQIENEYGFCGEDHEYIRKLVDMAKRHLGPDVVLYTTDPPGIVVKGSLPGDEIFTAVDFGPGWFDPVNAYKAQQRMNAPGKSPPICTEFYTGWLTHYGEKMANTSTCTLADDTAQLLKYGNDSGSLNFYMVHGGTNFAFWAGANVDSIGLFMPHITSYDYDAPISEAGDYGQPGILGDSKYDALRQVIAAHTGSQQKQKPQLPPVPPRPRIQAYGSATMKDKVSLFTPGVMGDPAVVMEEKNHEKEKVHPGRMEDYGQLWGYINYRTKIQLPSNNMNNGGDGTTGEIVSWKLDLGKPVHDYGSIYANGQLIAKVDRNNKQTVIDIPVDEEEVEGGGRGEMVLDIFVEAFGHQNFGCDTGNWDYKGLQSSNITLNGKCLWVFPSAEYVCFVRFSFFLHDLVVTGGISSRKI
jgi:beta-galactosidase